MSDSYQAVYDAVRSKISGGDIGAAVEEALRSANLSHYADMASRAAQEAASEYARPSAVYRPVLIADGDQWCALYGEDLQVGVAGFGETPFAAMYAFDRAWLTDKTPDARRSAIAKAASSTPAEGAE